ncbi:MAG: hypothetical protein JWM53_4492, partial [bacterium]|nr:hypothetical protein [bacterium]
MSPSFDDWLGNLERDGDGRDELAAAIASLRARPTLAPHGERILALLRSPAAPGRRHQPLRDALSAGARADDPALRVLVAELVSDSSPRHAALEGVLVAAAHAHESPALAAL